MYLFEFNIDKMTWTKTAQTTNPGSIYASFKFTDDEYFKSCYQIIKNLMNNKYKLILIDHNTNKSWISGDIYIDGWDCINDNPKLSTLTKEQISLTVCYRGGISSFGDLNNYWLYIQYE